MSIDEYFAMEIGSQHSAWNSNEGYYSESLDEQPEDILMELIARFGRTIMRAREDLEK